MLLLFNLESLRFARTARSTYSTSTPVMTLSATSGCYFSKLGKDGRKDGRIFVPQHFACPTSWWAACLTYFHYIFVYLLTAPVVLLVPVVSEILVRLFGIPFPLSFLLQPHTNPSVVILKRTFSAISHLVDPAPVGVDVHIKFGDSRSNRFRDSRGADFVSNERTDKRTNENWPNPIVRNVIAFRLKKCQQNKSPNRWSEVNTQHNRRPTIRHSCGPCLRFFELRNRPTTTCVSSVIKSALLRRLPPSIYSFRFRVTVSALSSLKRLTQFQAATSPS